MFFLIFSWFYVYKLIFIHYKRNVFTILVTLQNSVFHWYNEIFIISHYLGIAILESECAAAAATACLPLLDRGAPMFRQVHNFDPYVLY